MGIALISATYTRAKKTNFAMPFYPIDASFCIGRVKESMIWAFLKPFQSSIWWTMLGSLTALFMTYLVINWALDVKNASGYLMSCLKLAVRQGELLVLCSELSESRNIFTCLYFLCY